MPDLADLFPGYESHWIDTSAGRIFARTGGDGPPLLLLHGYAQTNVMWHKVAPALAAEIHADHARSAGLWLVGARRAPARVTRLTTSARWRRCMIELMEKLGHARFDLAGHDRGGRVAYRLALDHPGRLIKLAVLDIIPTYEMWHRMDHTLAMKVWHWLFLAQKYPMPEMLIEKAPIDYLDYKMASWTKAKDLSAFDPRALAHYHAFFSDPLRIHATCEDYRAGETTDLGHDEADHAARNKITTPMLALWGTAGIPSEHRPARDLEELGEGRVRQADRFRAFPAEENPDATAARPARILPPLSR